MPREEDFIFWNSAKSRGYMTQQQVEENVELLAALERVGSSKRAWDLAAYKGYMTTEQATEVRNPKPAPSAPPPPTNPQPAPPQVPPPVVEPYVPVRAAPPHEEAPKTYIPLGPRIVPERPEQPEIEEVPEIEPVEEEEAPAPAAVQAPGPVPEEHPAEPRKKGTGLIDLPPLPPRRTAPSPPVQAPVAPAPKPPLPAREAAPQPAPVAPESRGFQLVHIEFPAELKLTPITARPVSIGSGPLCDVVLTEPDVAERHARITTSGDVVTLWDMGTEVGVLVNHVRRTSCPLQPNDLIMAGSAFLVYLHDYAKDQAPQLTTPLAVGGDPLAMLSVLEGPAKASIFYVSEAPALIGRSPLANVRIESPGVSPLHAHLIGHSKGILLTDLGSRNGVLVNNLPVKSRVVATGDRVRLGEITLKVELLREPRPAATGIPAAEIELDLPKTRKKAEERSASEWDISSNVEVNRPESQVDIFGLRTQPAPRVAVKPQRDAEEPSDTTVRAVKELADGAEAPSEAPSPPELYTPGELCITCLEGPAEGTTWLLTKSSTTLGRDRHADISLHDLSVSRQHAAIIFTDRGVEARDLGSRNGIHVNGRRCRSSMINAGDTVRVGTCLFLIDRASKGSG